MIDFFLPEHERMSPRKKEPFNKRTLFQSYCSPYKRYPFAPCPEYLPIFTMNSSQMWVNSSYMEHMCNMCVIACFIAAFPIFITNISQKHLTLPARWWWIEAILPRVVHSYYDHLVLECSGRSLRVSSENWCKRIFWAR